MKPRTIRHRRRQGRERARRRRRSVFLAPLRNAAPTNFFFEFEFLNGYHLSRSLYGFVGNSLLKFDCGKLVVA